MLTLAADPQRAHFSPRNCATVAFILIALVPPLLILTVLWVWPIAGLTADRTAIAARDYTDMWAVGHFVAIGNGEVLFDRAEFNAALKAMFGAGFPDQMWPYPPPILLLAVPLSALALAPRFLLYTVGSMSLLWLVLRLGGLTKTAMLGGPSKSGGGRKCACGTERCTDRSLSARWPVACPSPAVLAGVMLGALMIKPQLGMLAPVCLLASRNWRALCGDGNFRDPDDRAVGRCVRPRYMAWFYSPYAAHGKGRAAHSLARAALAANICQPIDGGAIDGRGSTGRLVSAGGSRSFMRRARLEGVACPNGRSSYAGVVSPGCWHWLRLPGSTPTI